MIKKISITFFSKAINAVLGFLNAILITQFLGAEGKGVTSLFMTSVGINVLFCQITGGNVLVYLSSRIETSTLLIVAYVWAIVVAAFLSYVFYVIGACPPEYVVTLTITSIFFALFHAHLFILLGKEKSVLFNVLSPIPQLVQLLSIILLFVVFHQATINTFIYNLYYVFGGSYFVSLVFILSKINKWRLPNDETVKTIWIHGIKAQLSNILFFLNTRLFFYVLGYYFIKTEVGIYSVAVMIMEAVLLIGNSTSLMLYSKISNTTSTTEQFAVTKKYLLLSIGVTALALICVTCIPAHLYLLVFGPDFESVKILTLYLLPGTWMMSAYYVTSSYFSGVGKYQYNNYAVGLGLIVTFAGGLLFIPSGSIQAAAAVTSVAFCTIAIFSMWQFKRAVKMDF